MGTHSQKYTPATVLLSRGPTSLQSIGLEIELFEGSRPQRQELVGGSAKISRTDSVSSGHRGGETRTITRRASIHISTDQPATKL